MFLKSAVLSFASRMWRSYYMMSSGRWRVKQGKLSNRYSGARRRIVAKLSDNQKIKVLFLVRENQKWGAQSLYEEMELSGVFLPVIVVAPLKQLGRNVSGKQVSELHENYDFFKRKSMRVMHGYDVKKEAFISLDRFHPDIVFYDQPYGIARCHRVESVSRYALTCYIPYGYGFYLARESGQWSPSFLPLLWRVYLEDKSVLNGWDSKEIEKYGNCVHVGYPKMDALRTRSSAVEASQSMTSSHEERKSVIYAPHHSLEPGHHDRYATFSWSGHEILELAEKTPEIDWIFKPHPRLKYALVKSGLMSAEAVERYYGRWVDLPNATLVDDGGYIEEFNQSSAMITDCGSFLLEYLFTGKPLIHLVNQESRGYSEYGERLLKGFYRCRNQAELKSTFETVVLKGMDYMLTERMEHVVLPNKNAGELVRKDLEKAMLAM